MANEIATDNSLTNSEEVLVEDDFEINETNLYFDDGYSESESSLDGFFGFDYHLPELPNTLSGKIITGFTVYDATFIFVILLFIARLKDVKITEEKQPIFIPTRPPKGFRKYAILLETGQSPAGGTTSGVFIRLCGKLTKSPAFSLSWQNQETRQLFWSQNKDVFILSVPHYLGYVEAIEIMTDAAGQSPPWFLKSIRVMCLDNRKCWKTKINAWLRGDRKPFSFKASLIGALSTREYMKKVFLQNHSWSMMWHRPLGCTFTCSQRCAIQWTAVAFGMFAAHFLMYKWPYDESSQFDEATGLRIPIEYIVRGDDAVSSGVLGALAGTIIGMILRAIVRQSTSAKNWARVDDKDDFAHLTDPEDLIYTDGAVVIANRPAYSGPKFRPFPPCVDDTVLKILDTLSPDQVDAVKRMVDCGDGPCDMREMMDSKSCCNKNKDCASQKSNNAENGSDDKKQSAIKIQKSVNEKIDETTTEEVEDTPSMPMMADKRGYRKSIATAMNSLWDTALTGMAALTDLECSSEITEDDKVPPPSAGARLQTKNEQKRMKSYRKKRNQGSKNDTKSNLANHVNVELPSVSARISESMSNPSKASAAEVVSVPKELSIQLPEDYDSLSDPESDEEIITKAIRSYDINLRRRPQNVYDNAPWWDDRHRVYVSAPEAGNEHHQAVNERYDRTANPEAACCRVRADAIIGEEAILSYLEGEFSLPPGGVVEASSGGASAICGLALFVAFILSPYVVYNRLPLPNAHALYYLYAVMLCLVFHSLVFCIADAMFCAFLATWNRRRRIALVRDGETTENDDVIEEAL